MRRKYIAAILLVSTLTSMTVFTMGCSKKERDLKEAKNTSKEVALGKNSEESYNGTITQRADKFGLNIFKEEVANSKDTNVVVSPISIVTALDIVSNGAAGETKKQMKDVMGISSFTDESLNSEMNKVINNFNKSRTSEMPGFIKIYNSLWYDKKFKVKDSFIKTSKTFYDSDSYMQDMADNSVVDNMNKWVEEKTGGLIKKPIRELDKETLISVFNVLHFKGKWVAPFKKEDTKKDTFKLSSGNSTEVKMMNGQRMIPYYEDERVQAAVLNYYNGRMIILLPKEDINNFTSKLTTEDITKYEKQAKDYKTKVKLPVFNVKSNNSIDEVLKKMGMMLPFDLKKADFSNLKDNKETLSIGKVLHNCVVSVDEEGTEAAALTEVNLCGSALPPEEIKEFYVNKPFIFVIEDNRNNTILFAGKVEKPE